MTDLVVATPAQLESAAKLFAADAAVHSVNFDNGAVVARVDVVWCEICEEHPASPALTGPLAICVDCWNAGMDDGIVEPVAGVGGDRGRWMLAQ